MDEEIKDLGAKVSTAFKDRAKKFHFASMLVKGLLVAGGAAFAGIAQFVSWPPDQQPTTWQIIGIAATVIVFIGGLFVVFTESDASDELALSQEALQKAQAALRDADVIFEVESELERVIELYQAASILREMIENSTVAATGDDSKIAVDVIKLAGRSLAIAAGFQQNDRWTICIYKVVRDATTGEELAECVAHKRALDTDISTARSWPIGQGVAGLACLTKREQIIPDMHAPELQNLLGAQALSRSGDNDRYKSMAAFPIIPVGSGGAVWGVATATNDREGHFNHVDEGNIKYEEAIRMLAEFMGLALSVRAAHMRGAAPAVPATTP